MAVVTAEVLDDKPPNFEIVQRDRPPAADRPAEPAPAAAAEPPTGPPCCHAAG